MKGSPDTNERNSDEFDPHTDFAQFLEEARRHSNKKAFPEEGSRKKQENQNGEKIHSKKKSWKFIRALFSLWRATEKKTEQLTKLESTDNPSFQNQRHRHRIHVSGPVNACGSGDQHWRPASGPLTNLFHSKKKAEITEIPYVSLDKLTKPQYEYGPVYLVS